MFEHLPEMKSEVIAKLSSEIDFLYNQIKQMKQMNDLFEESSALLCVLTTLGEEG